MISFNWSILSLVHETGALNSNWRALIPNTKDTRKQFVFVFKGNAGFVRPFSKQLKNKKQNKFVPKKLCKSNII